VAGKNTKLGIYLTKLSGKKAKYSKHFILTCKKVHKSQQKAKIDYKITSY